MRDLGKLFGEFKGGRGASAAAIAECERYFGRELPKDYRDFMMITNGGEGFIGPDSYLRLWKIEELSLMNDGYETANYLPDGLLFGTDGGEEA
jgi:cell wall assembly regulator SMI1